MRFRRAGWAAVPAGLLAALLVAAGPALAHANLAGADPNPNSRLDHAPDRLRLVFSEPLEDTYTNVSVVGPDGSEGVEGLEIGEPDRRSIAVQLGNLSDGVHSVRWRTPSAADGHTRTGSYLLAVNASLLAETAPGQANDTRAPANATPAPAGPGWGEATTRGLAFLGASLAVGVPLVQLSLPARSLPDPLRRRITGSAALAGALAGLASLGLVALLAGRVGVGLAEAAATENGGRQALRGLLFPAAGALLAPATVVGEARRRGALLGAAVATGGLGLLATSLAGHAAAAGSALLVGFDLLHQASVAFWVGGVAVLAALAVSQRVDAEVLGDAIARLSPAFAAAVAAIVVTGSYASWVHLPGVDALWSSGYGRALAAKILLLVPLAGLGAYHRYVLGPRLAAGGRARIERTLGVEIVVMVAVLAAAGALTNTAPPGPAVGGLPNASPDASPDDGAGPPELVGVVHDANESGHRFEVAVRPQPVTVGAQNLSARVTPPAEGYPENASVIANLRPPSDPYGEGETRELDRWTNRTWTTEGPIFTEEGTWRVLVALQGKGAYASTEFELEVGRR